MDRKNKRVNKAKGGKRKKSKISKFIDFTLLSVLIASLAYIGYFFWNINQDLKASALPADLDVAEPSFIEGNSNSNDDTCKEYKTNIVDDVNLTNLGNGDFIGYMIFPEVSDDRWQIKSSESNNLGIESILNYSIAMDSEGHTLGTYGNTVMFGHNYLALKDIEIYEDGTGYIVLVVGNNTYVYEVYESKRVSDTDVEYVYGWGDTFPYTEEEFLQTLYTTGLELQNSNGNSISNDYSTNFIEVLQEAGFESPDLLTIYTCTQQYPGAPITGRTVVKLKQVEQSRIC